MEQMQMQRRGLLVGLSSFFNYSSYHKYKKAVAINNSLLYVFAFCLIASLFANNPEVQAGVSSVGFVILIIYMFRDYWIEAKKRSMASISSETKRTLGLVSKKLNLYDGIYSENGRDSIELSFFKDYTFLGSFFRFVKNNLGKKARNKQIDVLDEDEVEDIKIYAELLKEQTQFVIYATMTQAMASQLEKAGLTLKMLPRKYVTKPGRLNACANELCRQPWKVPAVDAYTIALQAKKANRKKPTANLAEKG